MFKDWCKAPLCRSVGQLSDPSLVVLAMAPWLFGPTVGVLVGLLD